MRNNSDCDAHWEGLQLGGIKDKFYTIYFDKSAQFNKLNIKSN